jgi:hypothetical protein
MFDGGRPAERLTVQIWAGTGYARPARPPAGLTCSVEVSAERQERSQT